MDKQAIRAELEKHLTTITSIADSVRIQLCTHPDTGQALYLPKGYDVQHQAIVKRTASGGDPTPLYSGIIIPIETGADLYTGEQTVTIFWKTKHHQRLTIPSAVLSDSKEFGRLLSGAGATIHTENARKVAALIAEFIPENRDALPHRLHADRLGLIGDGLMLPGEAIGFPQEVRYIHKPKPQVGTDYTIYPAVIAQAATWNDTDVLFLDLALSLAAPHIARLRPRRNPASYLSGSTGCGKTTERQFVVGVWGDPTRKPFHVEAGRTTRVGYIQLIERLGGLPVLVDEAHTAVNPKMLEGLAYDFANGQAYTKGHKDGRDRGGEPLTGVLFFAGEAVAEFKHGGSARRVLWIDGDFYYPLGVAADTREGAARTAVLEQAWEAGAGTLGPRIAKAILNNWTAFVADVRTWEAYPALQKLSAWREPLACAAATLQWTFRELQLSIPATELNAMVDQWATMLEIGHQETDPATAAFERLILLLAQGERHGINAAGEVISLYKYDTQTKQTIIAPEVVWEVIMQNRALIACRRVSEDHWRIPTNSKQFKLEVGANVAQLYGQTWIKQGWVIPSNDGSSTRNESLSDRGKTWCVCVNQSTLETWNG
jgi:hypothetical protein